MPRCSRLPLISCLVESPCMFSNACIRCDLCWAHFGRRYRVSPVFRVGQRMVRNLKLSWQLPSFTCRTSPAMLLRKSLFVSSSFFVRYRPRDPSCILAELNSGAGGALPGERHRTHSHSQPAQEAQRSQSSHDSRHGPRHSRLFSKLFIDA